MWVTKSSAKGVFSPVCGWLVVWLVGHFLFGWLVGMSAGIHRNIWNRLGPQIDPINFTFFKMLSFSTFSVQVVVHHSTV